ncbi:MAG: hypothetical protein HY761_01090 [Candidatus Omnitrophica bacterium]|nr:hypothetical protein [Candidatus Omnitrophota bacterium]
MHVLMFMITIVILFIVARIGAIAFELTGLKLHISRFQALSCFTNTGFSTKESELIVSSHQRRKIASVLMIIGYAGFVSLIASFVNAMKLPEHIENTSVTFLNFVFPANLLPSINLALILFFTYISYKVFFSSKLADRLTELLKNRLIKRGIFAPIHLEEFMITSKGHCIANVEVCENSFVLNKEIGDPYFRDCGISILAIEREGEILANSPVNTKLCLGDKIICSGKIENIKKSILI